MNSLHCNYNVHMFTIGGSQYGFGHIVRLIPIYEIFHSNGFAPIMYIDGDKAVSQLLDNVNYVISHWLSEKHFPIKESDIVIIDTLRFPFDFFESIKAKTANIYFVSDDYIKTPIPAEIINWRVNSKPLHDNINMLSGEELVPLRPEIFNFRNSQKNKNDVIISMGGGDILNLIPHTVELLVQTFSGILNIKALISKKHRDYYSISKKFEDTVSLLSDLNTDELFREMASAEFAIASGGHTVYEFAYLGTPVIHVLVVQNQKPALEWNQTKFTYPIGWYNPETYPSKIIDGVNFFLNPKNLATAREAGKELIDGYGAQRIYNRLINQL